MITTNIRNIADRETAIADRETCATASLCAWLKNGAGRTVEAALQFDDGTFELVLLHEHGRARSVTQRTLARAISSALAVARATDAT